MMEQTKLVSKDRPPKVLVPKRQNGETTTKKSKEKDEGKVHRKRQPKVHSKETFLYVILSEQCSDEAHVQSFLQYRIGNVAAIKLDIADTTHVTFNANKCCLVTLRFESSKKAASIIHLLHKSNRNSSSKIHCFLNKSEALGEKTYIASCHESELEKAFTEIIETAMRAVLKHDEKLKRAREIKMKTEMVLDKNKGLSPTEFEKLSNEILAVDDKVLELERQRKEFNAYVQKMKSRLTEIIHVEKFDKELKEIRKHFGVECVRLGAALPMYARRADILNIVRSSQVSVILGETGSGKSTQMVQYLYQAGLLIDGMVACTQPRKIAAVSLATRVASELASGVGQVVGYRVGMQSKTSAVTKIVYMTDHILLNECLVDTELSKYSCIIIDEAHERSIYTDLLLGMLKKTLSKRPELKVIITSATIDPDLFVSYFGGEEKCPVLKVSGRTFPVDVIWAESNSENPFPEDYVSRALGKAIEIHNNTPIEDGDILVFLSSPAETEACAERMKKSVTKTNMQCLQLHGKLKPEEQQLVFAPSPCDKRKIVFATNSAETSITIPGIKFVVDAGVVKEMRFDHKKSMSSLDVVPVSQSSANQRKGRAGRTESGKCYRLYTEDDYDSMVKIASPEILRIQVSQAMLKLIALGVDPLSFDYVQSPPREAMESALEELTDIGAITNRTLTELGKWIAALPVEPKLGALIKKGIDRGIPAEVLVVAGISSQSGIFYRSGSIDEKKTADMKKMQFCHSDGDILTALHVYRQWDNIPEKAKGRWCAENSVNGKAMKGVRDMMNETLATLKKEFGLQIRHTFKPAEESNEIVKQLIFECMINNLAIYLGHESAGYLIVQRMQRVQLHPSSAIAALGYQPEWVVFSRVLKTSADFMTEVTTVTKHMVEKAVKTNILTLDIGKIEDHKVRLVLSIPLGNDIFRTFVGRCHSNRRKIEDDIRLSCNQTPVVIDANKRLGNISLFCLPEYTESASNMLRSVLENMTQRILLESKEEYIGSVDSGARAVLREGGSTVEILTQNQFRILTVKLTDMSKERVDEEYVREILNPFGYIEQIWKKKGYSPVWGKVTYVESKNAVDALDSVNKDEQSKIRLSPVTSGDKHGNKWEHNQNFTMIMSWCRRQAKGVCYVSLSRPEDKVVLATSSAVINGSVLPVKMSKTHANASKSQSDLFIKGIKPDTTEEHVKEGLAQVLGLTLADSRDRFNNIVIPRTDPPWTQDLHLQKQGEISNLIKAYGEDSFKVNVREVKAKTVKGLAFVTFSEWKTCCGIGERLKANAKIDGGVIAVNFECKSNVYVAKRVYEVIKDDMDLLINELKDVKQYTNVTSRQMKNENYSVDIKTSTPEKLAQIKFKIDKLVSGEIIGSEKLDKMHALFSQDGRSMVKEIENKTGTLIFTDERQKNIIVRGTTKRKSDAISMIEQYIENIQSQTQKVLHFKGEDNPPGLLKALIKKYGIKFGQLKDETGVSSVHLNLRSHAMTLSGSEDAIELALKKVGEVGKEVQFESHKQTEKEFPDCPICLCPVEESDISKLEYCGHSYCKPCLSSQIESAISDRQFPIVCAVENCNKALVIKDFETQVRCNNITWKGLREASVSCLVTKNSELFKYCITPDCEMVYWLTAKDNIFLCPVCQTKVCTTCHVQFHEGLTCEQYQNGGNDENGGKDENSLEEWLKQDPALRKLCPKCGFAIEKISGCNRMTCNCGANICWKCLEYFETSDQCYNHLSATHGGAFDY